jgi:altronate dehydratase small subunit
MQAPPPHQPAAPAQALVIHPDDNVAVVTQGGAAGQTIAVRRGANSHPLLLCDDLPFGHKVALTDLAAGAVVRKYGVPIAVAATDIAAGQHVHVHNLVGLNTALRG